LVFLIVVPAFVVAQTPGHQNADGQRDRDHSGHRFDVTDDHASFGQGRRGHVSGRARAEAIQRAESRRQGQGDLLGIGRHAGAAAGAAAPAGSTSAAVTPGKGKFARSDGRGSTDHDSDREAIDPKVPSVTVTTEDGRTVTRKIEDPNNVAKLKVGVQSQHHVH
jgi:hypothetical protein